MFLHERPQFERYVAASRHAKKVLELHSAGVSLSQDFNRRQPKAYEESRFIRDTMRTDDIQGTTSEYVK